MRCHGFECADCPKKEDPECRRWVIMRSHLKQQDAEQTRSHGEVMEEVAKLRKELGDDVKELRQAILGATDGSSPGMLARVRSIERFVGVVNKGSWAVFILVVAATTGWVITEVSTLVKKWF